MRISSALLARLTAEAAASPAHEICGLLLGAPGAILDAAPARNVVADPERAFEVDPRALFAAIRAQRAGGTPVIGHYHSHPSGRAVPSARDAAAALEPGRLWLILAGGEARLWRATPGGAVEGAFDPVALQVAAG